MDKLKNNFICRTRQYSTAEEHLPMPLFRKSFSVKKGLVKATLYITSLGYYEVHINGEDITKGFMAPYRSCPDHYVYYDTYEISENLTNRTNAIGIILGNGFQNSIVETWDFDKFPWRSAPAVSFCLELEYEGGEIETVISDENTKTYDSAIIFNDFHCGEHYDARLYIKDWDKPCFDDGSWDNALKVEAPRGEICKSFAEPIIKTGELTPVSVTKWQDGYIYNFGENNTGLCLIKIKGEKGQRLELKHFEAILDSEPFYNNIDFDGILTRDFQHDIYICSGEGIEEHIANFTYHGFQYVYVTGITEEQATKDLLTFCLISSDIKQTGFFECDNDIINKIQEATIRSDISNFHYFPTDCPHREKQGWTADASLSAEQMLLNFSPEKSYKQWVSNVYKAMKDDGQLPGIVPTGTWGYEWGNGPAWDNVIAFLPYYTYLYRGDKEIISDLALPMMRYLSYLYSQLDGDDLLALGLGDWCQPGKKGGGYDTPLVVTDSIVSIDIARKAEFIYGELDMPEQKQYAKALAERITKAFRKKLIKDGLVEGSTQTGQAMALYYGMIEEKDKNAAFSYLLKFIEEKGGHLYTGVLGAAVIFRVLSDFGKVDLAFDMITRTDFPSYGNWIKRGATTLWERFWTEDEEPYSMNHHFWGTVSAWFYSYLAGIRINPKGNDINNIDVVPYFVQNLNYAKAETLCLGGKIRVEWHRNNEGIELLIDAPENIYGEIKLQPNLRFADTDQNIKPLKTGKYIIK